jgi:hypothetical protein
LLIVGVVGCLAVILNMSRVNVNGILNVHVAHGVVVAVWHVAC